MIIDERGRIKSAFSFFFKINKKTYPFNKRVKIMAFYEEKVKILFLFREF